MRLHGNLANVEEEWRIAALPEWIDPVFVFQRTWFPNDVTRPGSSFNANLAKAVSILGGGLAGYYIWRRTENKAYAAIAGAGSALAAPLLVSAYDNFQNPRARLSPWIEDQDMTGEPVVANTYLAPNARLVVPRIIDQRIVSMLDPSLVSGSPDGRQTMNLVL